MSYSPADIIRNKSLSVVESYHFTRTKNCNWASSLTKLAHATAQEYEDRFLIELIQNGYDVHDPKRADGTIWIHFARSEGECGTLYVANGGRPFTESNFHAICEIAQSDKEPGAGIGNKGVGFKSVLHVCNSPEIYSVDPASVDAGQFSGFCFRFARAEDYLALCDGDESRLSEMQRDVSPYFLPVHIPNVPASVSRFAAVGAVTVIRMPISRSSGSAIVTQQLQALRTSPVPILLFLPRVRQLVVEESEEEKVTTRTALTRRQSPIVIDGPEAPQNWSIVTINHDEAVGEDHPNEHDGQPTDGQRYFVASEAVCQSRLKAAISESIDQGYLDERFAHWTEVAEVSVAIPMGGDTPTDCRLYTFLPMGQEARCPFGGHLNAPFAPNLARTHVNLSVPLNSLFFDVAAELVADAVLGLSTLNTGLPESIVIDLITWKTPYISRLSAAIQETGQAVAEMPLFPLVASDSLPSRGSVADAYSWNNNHRVFSSLELRRITKASILAPIEGANRNARLIDFARSVGYSLDPAPEVLAEWAENVAADLAAKPFAAAQWNDYYADLAVLFTNRGEALTGRKVLFDSSKSLRQAGPFKAATALTDRPAVFFPPTTERSEDDEELGTTSGVAIPTILSRHMCYLHEELSWYERDGTIQRRTAAREFLQRAQLVQRFDTRSLVEHCSRISQHSTSDAVRASALYLAFSLQRAARSRDALGLERLPFYVPSTNGWILATEALFSSRWPGMRGSQVASLITHASSVSPDIKALEGRLIASPTEEPFNNGNIEDWKDFLCRLGVRSGLWPIEMPLSNPTYRGDALTKSYLGRLLKMPDDAIKLWERTRAYTHVPSHPYTDYRIQTPFFRLPGQFEFGQFSNQAKSTFARLVFSQIGTWASEHFSSKIERPRASGKDTLAWPTPLTAFLHYAAWLPIRTDAGTEEYVTPSDAWYASESDGITTPGFLPLVSRDLRRQLDEGGAAYERLVTGGRLRVVGNASDSPALLVLLGQLLASDQVGNADLGAFRRLYFSAWQQMLELDSTRQSSFTGASTLHLALVRGTSIVPVKVRDAGAPCCEEELFVVDTEDRLRRQLLTDLQFPTLDVGARFGARVVTLLRGSLGIKVRASSSVQIEVLVDDSNVIPGPDLPPLFDEGTAWVKYLIALIIQLKGRVFGHHSQQALLQAQKRLSALHAVKGSSVGLRVDNEHAQLSQLFRDAVLINDTSHPTIAYRGETPWTWDMLERLVPSMVAAIDRVSIQADVEVAVHRLARSAVDAFTQEPTDQEIAEALSTSVEEVQLFRGEWRSHERSLLECVYPLIFHWMEADIAAHFEPLGSALTSKDEIRTALLALRPPLPCEVDYFLGKCATSANLAALRDDLQIDYASFNHTLCAIGRPYKPFRNEEGHRNQFAFFTQTHIDAILCRLRANFLSAFRERASLQPYTSIRDLSTLQPDAQWLEQCDLPSELMMKNRVNLWLQSHGALSLDEPAPELLDLSELRTENRKAIRIIVNALLKVLPVWCSKNHAVAPNVWAQANAPEIIADAMLALGLNDFERLTDGYILRWLSENGHLPANMPQSTESEALGLSADDFARGESELERQKRERELERRTIEIDGNRFSSSAADCEALIAKVRSTILPGFLACPAAVSKLEPVSGREKPKGGPSGGGVGLGSDGRMTDAQKHATGLVGELLAFEWLKVQYEGATETCWKSKYRDLVFGGNLGNDSLGYDFEVLLKATSYMFEVKATTGSEGVIELGATELETSQRFARSNRFRILVVSNVLDAAHRRILVLPNPFSKRGRGLFEATGTGIKFRFAVQ